MAKHANNETPNAWITSPATRRYIYAVATALMALLIGNGIVTAAESSLWLGVIEALLGLAGGGATALAAANVPRR